MLFYLTDTLIVEDTDLRYNDIRTAVYLLAVQAAAGNHAVIGDINAITYFRKVFENDFMVGQFFNNVYQNIAFEVVPSFITYYVEVVLEAPHTRTEEGKTIAQVKYTRMIPFDATNKTSLVCEFLYDAEFYAFVLKWYINQLHLNIHYAFNEIDGGGTNTHLNIEKELKADHITISILDTDCRFPGAQIDPESTYGKCIGIGSGNVLYKMLPLVVHEVENLVPLNYIDQEFSNWTKNDVEYARKKKAFDYLKKDAEHILPYYDYKKGIKNNEEYRKSQELQDFARRCYALNDEKVAAQPNFDQFVNSLQNKANIYTELIGGTGTICMTLQAIRKGNAPEPLLFDFQRANWVSIGQEMLNWCIARKPEAIH